MAVSLIPEVIFHANDDFIVPADEEQRKALIALCNKILVESCGYTARDVALQETAQIRLAALKAYQSPKD